MKRIFITGGAGFIGRHLCRRLLSAGYHVSVIDNFVNSSEENFRQEFGSNDNLQLIKGDISDRALLEKSIRESQYEAVVHLAAIISVEESIRNPQAVHEVNAAGTQNVVDAMQAAGVKKLIFASSAAVYGNTQPPLKEDIVQYDSSNYAAKLLSPYAESKWVGEKIIIHSGTDFIIFRIFNVYGKGQAASGAYPAVISAFTSRLNQGQNIILYGDGRQTRDFISVVDVISAIEKAIEKQSLTGVFNLATGQEVSLLELIAALEEAYSRKIEVQYQPERSGDIKKSFADIYKLKNSFGFTPEVKLKEGLKQLL